MTAIIASCLRNERHVPVGDLPHEFHIWLKEHDVEMLDRVDRLERLPVLEPHEVFSRHAWSEGALDVLLDRLARFCSQIARGRVIGDFKLGPNHEVDDVCVRSIGPIVVQDANILWPFVSFSPTDCMEATVCMYGSVPSA